MTNKWLEKACENQALRMVAEASEEGLRARLEIIRQAKLELDELEAMIEQQTCDEHHRADFDMPDDAELHIVLTAKDERRLSNALSVITRALTDGLA